MKTVLILLSILGMACALSMKNLNRRAKLEDSEENGVFKYRPQYYVYKHGYFYPALKRFAVQSSSDSSEENGNGDSSEEEEEEEETSNEEGNNGGNEDSDENEDEESEAENTTLSTTTLGYGEITPGTGDIGLAAIWLPRKAGATGKKATKEDESDEEEEEEEEEENEAEVDDNEQGINGTSSNSTEVDNGHGSSGGDNGEEDGEEESVTEANTEGITVAGETTTSPNGGFKPTTPHQEVYGTTPPPFGKITTPGEYEQTGTNEYDNGYEIYESENGDPRGDNYRAYEDEYSYYKGRGYDSYDGQDYYSHQ
ncbi:integrin-binding sialoprotein isoform X1 [Bos taurus]|uniref:Integrin-binding sialoprotein n=3 Tax=Bos TaxID=9903 RepID=SIAL_BOVIN|nr:bone sialoprotein 2 precursor [Bos taurus]XP_010804306.1 bone sialoprotein 2 isoform X1 [Bos taurus]Q28862.1 RecName: Full=Bone sialoprotein 2; AltName: Full=Bone sialoprotein II; Short=BSP II; AltName: Full=Cell-binding sialoprotein; AltName: Full=Integrin-binding sialoprotein; Flags: Precursor [Bos taurus]AAB30817.1 bone sialoprotein [Bos taurus]DAA28791.1 TPA: bone sialoprotein 2 precursor [Bos taurus]